MSGDSKSDFANWKERDKAVEKLKPLEGWRLGEKIDTHEISLSIFQGNFEDLMSQIQIFKEPTSFIILHDVRNSEELHKFFKQITRLFHNYLASAFTLVDHTRNLVQDLYEGEEFSEFRIEYDSRKNTDFAENPLHRFIQELRNYVIHKWLPIIGSTLNLNEIKANLIIDISNLRNNFKWSGLAKEYIDSKGEDEELENIVLDHFKHVSNFHDWFYSRQLEIHSEQFEETNELRKRIHNSRWTPKI